MVGPVKSFVEVYLKRLKTDVIACSISPASIHRADRRRPGNK